MIYAMQESWLLLSFVFSLCIGSFLNVVIYRVPRMVMQQEENEAEKTTFNLLLPGSSCPSCGEKIRSYDNIPVFSWLWLRGRCRYCRQRISAKYPLIEAVTALGGVLLAAKLGMGLDWLFMLALFCLLLSLAVIDLEWQLLPDMLTLPLLWVGLVWHSLVNPAFLPVAVFGAIAGYLVLWLLYWGFKLLTGREGLGYGDFKLLAALGAWAGYPGLPNILLTGSVSTLCVVLILRLSGRYHSSQTLPFGPGLALGGMIWMVCYL